LIIVIIALLIMRYKYHWIFIPKNEGNEEWGT